MMMQTKMMAVVKTVIMVVAADLPSSLSGETNWWQILGRGSCLVSPHHWQREERVSTLLLAGGAVDEI